MPNNRSYHIEYLWIIFFIFHALNIHAKTLAYEEIVSITISNSPKLKIRQTDVKIQQSNVESLYSKFYPQISIVYNNEYNKNLDANTKNISVGNTSVNSSVKYENSLAFGLNYELYHFGTTNEQIKAAKQEIEVKKVETCLEEARLKEEILNHYVKALSAYDDIIFFKEIRELNKQIYEYKSRLQQSGIKSKLTVLDEAVKLIELENKIEQSRVDYIINVLALSKLSYINLDLNSTKLVPLLTNENNVTTNTGLRYEDTSSAKQYQEKLEQKQSEINSLKLSILPIVSLSSNYYYYGSDQNNFTDSYKELKRNSWNIGLNLRWDIFEGFKYYSELKKLELEKVRLLYEYEFSKKEFEMEISSKIQNIYQMKQILQNESQSLQVINEIVISNNLLIEEGEIDAISHLESKINKLYKKLSLQKYMNNYNYENILLRIKSAKDIECSNAQ